MGRNLQVTEGLKSEAGAQPPAGGVVAMLAQTVEDANAAAVRLQGLRVKQREELLQRASQSSGALTK